MSSGAAGHTDPSPPRSELAISSPQDDVKVILQPQEHYEVAGHGHGLIVIVPHNHTLTIAEGHNALSSSQQLTLAISTQSEDTDGPLPRSATDADTPLSPCYKRATDDDSESSFLTSATVSARGEWPMRSARPSARVSRQSSQFSTEDDAGEPKTAIPFQDGSRGSAVLPHGGWVLSLSEEPQDDEDPRTDGEDDL
ncbi:hypothetical protein ONZ51_g2487 [Trametes cubensis]|uniref:Uncharacterized protein n=1 Tax=Trametes cubensis TaxID=1111947 RepID=A0AAD7U265_9APHY|nr:hypothetical protein ONZ51_g2487 [Trametes cubensis]